MAVNRKRDFLFIFLIVAFLALFPFVSNEYHVYLARLIGIHVIAALGLNIFMGYCGQINLGSAAFYCIGAYGSTILQVHLGLHYFLAFTVAMVINFIIALALSYPLLRLKGHTAAIGTISLGMATYLIADRFPSLTGGSDGIIVPPTVIFGYTMGEMFYYYFILAFVVATYVACYFLTSSPSGRALQAVKGDEIAAEALGLNVYRYKLLAWMVSCVFGGIAGGLYAQQAGFLGPVTFGVQTNITFLLMIIVGGLRSNTGSVVGAVIITLLSYFLVTIQEYMLLAYGVTLFCVLRFMPEGIVGFFAALLNNNKWEKANSVEAT